MRSPEGRGAGSNQARVAETAKAALVDRRDAAFGKTRVTMSLNLEQKQAVVAEVAKEVAGAQAIVMVENRGLPGRRQ